MERFFLAFSVESNKKLGGWGLLTVYYLIHNSPSFMYSGAIISEVCSLSTTSCFLHGGRQGWIELYSYIIPRLSPHANKKLKAMESSVALGMRRIHNLHIHSLADFVLQVWSWLGNEARRSV